MKQSVRKQPDNWLQSVGSAPSMPGVSIIIPVNNEAETIVDLIDEILATALPVNFEIIVIDDGSSDETAHRVQERMRRPLFGKSSGPQNSSVTTLRLLQLRNNVGQSTALLVGAREARGQLLVMLDGDGQNDPADIPVLMAAGKSLTAPFCVIGNRVNRKDSAWKRLQSLLANRFRSSLLHDGVPDTGCALKLIPRETYLSLPYFDHMHRFTPALIRRLGGEIRVCTVRHRPRRDGQSHYNAWNRASVGLVDVIGMIWLIRRNRLPRVDLAQSTSSVE